MEANIVTLRGATRKEADQILTYTSDRSSEAVPLQGGQRTVALENPDVIIHHYVAGGEVDLLSNSLNHEELLDLLPDPIRQKVTVSAQSIA